MKYHGLPPFMDAYVVAGLLLFVLRMANSINKHISKRDIKSSYLSMSNLLQFVTCLLIEFTMNSQVYQFFYQSKEIGEDVMTLSAPTRNLFLIAVIIGVIGIVAHFIPLPVATPNQFWFVTVGFVLLMIGALYKDL